MKIKSFIEFAVCLYTHGGYHAPPARQTKNETQNPFAH